MEQRLDRMPDLGYEEEPIDYVKVALTTFAFRNAEVIHLLTERGQIIKEERWDEMKVIDKKINDLKNQDLEKLTTPCSVFMTFENEEGINRALNYDDAIQFDSRLNDIALWLNEYKL